MSLPGLQVSCCEVRAVDMVIFSPDYELRLSVCVCVCVCESCSPVLCNPMDCSPPGSPIHEILQARTLEWVAMPFSRDLTSSGMEASLLHCRQILYHLSHQGSPN